MSVVARWRGQCGIGPVGAWFSAFGGELRPVRLPGQPDVNGPGSFGINPQAGGMRIFKTPMAERDLDFFVHCSDTVYRPSFKRIRSTTNAGAALEQSSPSKPGRRDDCECGNFRLATAIAFSRFVNRCRRS
jgi:hypothetical protein